MADRAARDHDRSAQCATDRRRVARNFGVSDHDLSRFFLGSTKVPVSPASIERVVGVVGESFKSHLRALAKTRQHLTGLLAFRRSRSRRLKRTRLARTAAVVARDRIWQILARELDVATLRKRRKAEASGLILRKN